MAQIERPTFRIVHAHAAGAEKLANDLADDYVLSNINFYVLDGVEKVAMLFVVRHPHRVSITGSPAMLR